MLLVSWCEIYCETIIMVTHKARTLAYACSTHGAMMYKVPKHNFTAQYHIIYINYSPLLIIVDYDY